MIVLFLKLTSLKKICFDLPHAQRFGAENWAVASTAQDFVDHRWCNLDWYILTFFKEKSFYFHLWMLNSYMYVEFVTCNFFTKSFNVVVWITTMVQVQNLDLICLVAWPYNIYGRDLKTRFEPPSPWLLSCKCTVKCHEKAS